MKFFLWGLIISLISVNSYADVLRDPTRPDFFTNNKVQLGQLVLNAIIISNTSQVAVINGIVVKVGDDIGNAKVTSIAPNTVQLDGPDGKITLFLVDKSLKQPTTGN